MFARAQISSKRCQSALFLASLETSSTITMPARPKSHIRYESPKSFPPSRRCTRLSLVGIDNDDSIVGPAERCRASAKPVLPLRTLDVLEHLFHRRPPDVQVRVTLEVRLDFARFVHGASGSWTSSPSRRRGESQLAVRHGQSTSERKSASVAAACLRRPPPGPIPTGLVEERARGRGSTSSRGQSWRTRSAAGRRARGGVDDEDRDAIEDERRARDGHRGA